MRVERLWMIGAVWAALGAIALARAATVRVGAEDLLRRDVVVRAITPQPEYPVRYAYGRAIGLGAIVAAVSAIDSARAAAQLDSTLLRETRALYRAPYHISAQKLAQAQAAAAQTRARLASLVGVLRARYGVEFTQALLGHGRLAARISRAAVSVVEAIVPYPLLQHPPRAATARIDGGALMSGRSLTLRLLGVGGRMPSGMIGQALYYLGPALQAGTMLRVRIRLDTRPVPALRVPLSALIFDGRTAIAFRRTGARTFRSFALLRPLPFYTHGHVGGDQIAWPGRAPVPIVIAGAGLLWSLIKSNAGSR